MRMTKHYRSKGSYRRTRRGPTTASLQKTKAAKRFNWVASLDSTCGYLQLPPHACSVGGEGEDSEPQTLDCADGSVLGPGTAARFELLAPNDQANSSQLGNRDAYQLDDVTVTRIVGHLDFYPYFVLTANALAIVNAAPGALQDAVKLQFLAQRHWAFRAGLSKDRCTWDATADEWVFPNRDPWFTENWTDAHFLKFWFRERMFGEGGSSTADVLTPGSVVGVCSDTHMAAKADGNLVSGTGSVPGNNALSTDCSVVVTDPTDASVYTGTVLSRDPKVRINLSSRRRLRFKENEGLSLWVNYSTPTTSDLDACFPNLGDYTGVGFIVRAHVKLLIET